MLRTHYDNLKIARDAPVEVVRAAYRALCLKYHPDRHAADPEATEMMALLNSAYDVLSDPEKRREYDDWIRFVESKPAREREDAHTEAGSDWIGAPGASDSPRSSRPPVTLARFRPYWVFYVLALVAIFMGSLWYESLYLHRSKALTPLASALSTARQESPPALDASPFARPSLRDPSSSSRTTPAPPQSEPVPAVKSDRPAAPPRNASSSSPAASAPHAAAKAHPQQQEAPSAAIAAKRPAPRAVSRARATEDNADAFADDRGTELYTRPAAAPNGEVWPSSSDYVAGYQQRNTNGLSQVVIDNTQNPSDAFVKVVSVGESEPKVVRNIFIQAADRFTVSNLRAGTYEIRYQNLDSGRVLRSEVFALEESAIASGTRYSTVTLTLRTRADESMNTFALPREQF
jgi:DnaJ-like protein